MKAAITVLGGDGIGPEVIAEAAPVLQAVAARFRHEFTLSPAPFGGIAIEQHGEPLPPATLKLCLASDAILLGAIGGPKWSSPQAKVRPESGLLRLRRELGVYANLRPVSVHPELRNASSLKPEIIDGVDLIFVRELTGGIYFGAKTRDAHQATDLCTYTTPEIERIVRVAAQIARTRRRRLLSIDKSNVLETSRLWREVCERVMHNEFPDVQLEHMLVDSAAMHLIRRPRDIDVAVTENLYEPIHGSAPDIAGQGIANPYGAILSVALLLRHSLKLEQEARAVELAVHRAIGDGVRTADIAAPNQRPATTQEAGAAVLAALA
jgi:3-isopropylmalate dehydrogenase